MAEIGTKKIFENEKFALWEMVLEPGERTEVHTHSHDYVFYVLEGSTGVPVQMDVGRMQHAERSAMRHGEQHATSRER